MVVHGVDIWTVGYREANYVKSFEMWMWRIIQKRKCTDMVSNEMVMNKTGGKNYYNELQKAKQLVRLCVKMNSSTEIVIKGIKGIRLIKGQELLMISIIKRQ